MDSVLIHDVKNVEMRLSLLLSNLEERYGDPEFKRSVVDLLGATIEKLDGIVGRYSSHPDSLLVKVPLDPNDLLREAARVARPKAGAARGRLVTDFGEAVAVWGDANLLTEAFASLVQNAFEAAGESGNVRLETRVVWKRKRPIVVVTIDDDGPGMPADFVKGRLFHPFQTTKKDGVGLGLYTARQILGFHGGTIAVESRTGRGTRVTVSLPGEVS